MRRVWGRDSWKDVSEREREGMFESEEGVCVREREDGEGVFEREKREGERVGRVCVTESVCV